MAELRLPSGPEELIQYFEGVNREYPGEQWREGAEMCRRWVALLSNPTTQKDIDQFVARLEAAPHTGSGWLDLGIQFRKWATSKGFKV